MNVPRKGGIEGKLRADKNRITCRFVVFGTHKSVTESRRDQEGDAEKRATPARSLSAGISKPNFVRVWNEWAGTRGLELAASAVTALRELVLRQLTGTGDCQSMRKSYKRSHFVGWAVGWEIVIFRFSE